MPAPQGPSLCRGLGRWPQEAIDFVDHMSVATVTRCTNPCIKSYTLPKSVKVALGECLVASLEVAVHAIEEGDLGEGAILGYKIHFLAARLLLFAGRGGGMNRSLSATLQQRCRLFMEGKWERLWKSLPKRTCRGARTLTDAEIAKEVEDFLVPEGQYSRAAKALERAEPAPATMATYAKLIALCPDGRASGPLPDLPEATPEAAPLSTEAFLDVFRKPKKGSAGGPSGWSQEAYGMAATYCVSNDSVGDSYLYRFVAAVAAGKVPAVIFPFIAGGKLIALLKPAGGVRPIVIGEALRRLTGRALFKSVSKSGALQRFFCPLMPKHGEEAVTPDFGAGVVPAQVGVNTPSGCELLASAVQAALQLHDGSDESDPEPWVCFSVDFKNMFNSVSRVEALRALGLAAAGDFPEFADILPFLRMLYNKDPDSMAKLWVCLGGEEDFEDIISTEGSHQGCPFGGLVACAALQPVLTEVASGMDKGLVGGYCDDVKICGPISTASRAYLQLVDTAKERLGLVERVEKGSVLWAGNSMEDAVIQGMLEDAGVSRLMPGMGIEDRLLTDRHCGIFVWDGREESIAAAKAALLDKFKEKASLLGRLRVLSDPQVVFQLLRSVACARPGYWLRALPPLITAEAAKWYDREVASTFAECCLEAREGSKAQSVFNRAYATRDDHSHAWITATLPHHFGGLGLTSQTAIAPAAHYAMWLSSYASIICLFPTAVTLKPADIAASEAPFAREVVSSWSSCHDALTSITDNVNDCPLVRAIPTNPELPPPSDLGKRLPHAQQRTATLVHSARWLSRHSRGNVQMAAMNMGMAQKGAMAAFGSVPSEWFKISPCHFKTALERRLRLPLSVLKGVTHCKCGALIDSHGDHAVNCTDCTTLRCHPHEQVQAKATFMFKCAGFQVQNDSYVARFKSRYYSPLVRPDISLRCANKKKGHIAIDLTSVGVTGRTIREGAARLPRAAAAGAEAKKFAKYGPMPAPHSFVPFAFEDSGALGDEAEKLITMCKTKVIQESLAGFPTEEWTHSANSFSSFHRQSISAALIRGFGDYYESYAAVCKGEGTVESVSSRRREDRGEKRKRGE